ncbi:MAG: DEAD/DEAH box helicase family protein [Candidatus Sericytochromatia bacterium]|nr:DEAD/DEAH box helicase family protein [Candidatus Tanganyikabacteria bacterium]
MPFDEIPQSEWVAWNELAFAIRDRYPVSPGHSLVITKRRVPTWFDATRAERLAVLDLIDEVKQKLDAQLSPVPDGYNVGFNAGEAAGQSVAHLHVHVIPRYLGDMDDPRGGVRHVIPWKGKYPDPALKPLSTGGPDAFWDHIWPLFPRSRDIAILTAFVMDSGIGFIEHALDLALLNGASIRLVTGDYLNVTQVGALERLLDWAARYSALGLSPESGAGVLAELPESIRPGSLEVRVVEVAKLDAEGESFHPKSWRFEGDGLATAFVGSSNLSLTALRGGIEWNLRVDRARDAVAYRAVVSAFEALWTISSPLTAEWVADYARRARRAHLPLPTGEVAEERDPGVPTPNPIQAEALSELARARRTGNRRGLVVLATGLGKTWLAAFDVRQMARELGRFPRVLFIAHREELLVQAARTLRILAHSESIDPKLTWCAGEREDLSGDIAMASVQKLARPAVLARIDPEAFDYVVVDEAHHAHAPSYRRVLGRLLPKFMLGLTATPDRADEGDILALLDGNLLFRADLGKGIRSALLAPFAYFGLKDTVDYENIPWRNHRFDPEALARAVEKEARMERMWEAWQDHPASRTLVFCCSIAHANFVRNWLKSRGLRVEAVFSGPGSGHRQSALAALALGDLDAICSVDLFNEGVDVPLVDRVVMLRPTESPIVFLQQLGRGLRRADGKERLVVIDFVGNHRTFLFKVRQLVSLAEKATPLREYLAGHGEPVMPPGCSIEVEVEAKEELIRYLGAGGSEVERFFDELCDSREVRPTASELLHLGYLPSTLRGTHGDWFGFLEAKGRLAPGEVGAHELARAWFEELEITPMTKSFKMITLKALLDADAIFSGLPLADLARSSHAVLARLPDLLEDLAGVKEIADPASPDPKAWQAYWRKNPVAAWTEKGRWFALEGDRFISRLPEPPDDEMREAFVAMTSELVEYRLALYRRRRQEDEAGASFECNLIHAGDRPILKLPSKAKRSDLPQGETSVSLPDGRAWVFRFAKEYCNVGHPPGDPRNALPDLMREWFGLSAGKPGTNFKVRFSRISGGWAIAPMGIETARPQSQRAIPFFVDLKAAAGFDGSASSALGSELREVPLPGSLDCLFAVRAYGDSMNGGPEPISDGDWLVFRLARGSALSAWKGRVCLFDLRTSEGPDGQYAVKRLQFDRGETILASDSPNVPPRPAPPGAEVIGTLFKNLGSDPVHDR